MYPGYTTIYIFGKGVNLIRYDAREWPSVTMLHLWANHSQAWGVNIVKYCTTPADKNYRRLSHIVLASDGSNL